MSHNRWHNKSNQWQKDNENSGPGGKRPNDRRAGWGNNQRWNTSNDSMSYSNDRHNNEQHRQHHPWATSSHTERSHSRTKNQQRHEFGPYRDSHEQQIASSNSYYGSYRDKASSKNKKNRHNHHSFPYMPSAQKSNPSERSMSSNIRSYSSNLHVDHNSSSYSASAPLDGMNAIKKTFAEMSWKEKLQDQLRSANLYIEDIPNEIIEEPVEKILHKKKEAFNYAVRKVQERLKAMCDDAEKMDIDDDDDDEASDMRGRSEMTLKIVEILQKRDQNGNKECLSMAKRYEKSLYRNALSFQAYSDKSTLLERIQEIEDDGLSDDDDDDDDDFDIDDGAPYSSFSSSKRRKIESMYSEKEVMHFFKSLINNVVFDMGFKVYGLHPNDERNCWCPMGKHMGIWRECFNLEDMAGKKSKAYCGAQKKSNPHGLMSHMRKKGDSCPLHYGITMYLEKLYGDWKGTGHKGLYMTGDNRYKAAEAAEIRERANLLRDAIREKKEFELKAHLAEMEIQRREKEKKEWMAKLKMSTPDKFEEVEALDKNMKALKISDEDDEIPLDDEKVKLIDNLHGDYLKGLSFGVEKKKETKFSIEVKQSMNGEFDINEVFQNMEENKNILFSGTKGLNKFVYKDWEVKFKRYNESDRKKVKENTAVDEGGPTRQFFTLMWKNLEHLSLTYKKWIVIENEEATKEEFDKDVDIKLFTTSNAGLVPTADDYLASKIDEVTTLRKYKKRNGNLIPGTIINDDKEGKKGIILKRVEMYYRAVGIILFRAISSGNPIAHYVMPRFYQNVLLRNVEPKDVEKYSRRQMLIQLAEIGLNYSNDRENNDNSGTNDAARTIDTSTRNKKVGGKAAMDILNKSVSELKALCIIDGNEYDDNQIIDETSFFTVFLQHSIIKNQSIAIKNLKRGLTLDGQVNLQAVYALSTLKYVSEKLFAKPSVESKDLISLLVLFEDDEKKPLEHQKEFFNTVLKDVIREMTNEERKQFTFFCSGYDYLPHRVDTKEKFCIVVEFSYEEMEATSLPVAHTCVNTLKLPGEAYGNNKARFKSKLLKAMELSKGFSME